MNDLNRSRNLAVRHRAGRFHVLFLLSVLIAALAVMLAGQVTAQNFTTVYSFTATSTNSSGVYTNGDGSGPTSLILSDKRLYGTASGGGSSGSGTVFKVNTDGSGFTNLHSFTPLSAPYYQGGTNGDGAYPAAGLILSSNTLYGTTDWGGNSGNGTVFKFNMDGTGFRNLHDFTPLMSFTNSDGANSFVNSDGANPQAGLVSSGTTLYGTASGGGSSGYGTVFAVSTDGTGFTVLHSFTNFHGGESVAGLILSGSTLYGTEYQGGSEGSGTLFKVNTDGTGFTDLYTFTARINPCDCGDGTNTDGAFPTSVILSGNTLYGTTSAGGQNGGGTVFKVNTDGTRFSDLYNFTAPSAPFGPDCPCGGSAGGLSAGLVLWGNSLFGTTPGSGLEAGTFNLSTGTVFGLNTDGTGFTDLHDFSGIFGWYGSNFDGRRPYGLILSGNTLYGTTSSGGTSGNGTIFSISFTPQLTINPSGTNIILSWPMNYGGLDYTGFTVESTTNLASPGWTTNLTAPVVVNQQNRVTNPMSGTQQFFRLSQ